jgi:hypothetical protein
MYLSFTDSKCSLALTRNKRKVWVRKEKIWSLLLKSQSESLCGKEKQQCHSVFTFTIVLHSLLISSTCQTIEIITNNRPDPAKMRNIPLWRGAAYSLWKTTAMSPVTKQYP